MKILTRKISVIKLTRIQKFTLLIIGLIVLVFLLPSFNRQSEVPGMQPSITLNVQQVAGNLEALTDIAFPGNGDIWVTEQKGQVRVIRKGKLLDAPLLDLKDKMIKVNNGYEERGLLGITLHPQFKINRKFYVFYSAPSKNKLDHRGVLAEYKLPMKPGNIDPNTGRIILTSEHPDGNHNGGCIKFGPDGYLYVSFGDGGGQGDKHGEIGNGQKMDTWLGKILRININSKTTYSVPKDNPFIGRKNIKPEIWAYGFRNPYRFSFDKVSRALFTGEVGQDLWEEVDIVKKGANYGWRLVEGTHCYNPATGCNINGITMPIHEYSHKTGVSVIGGFVYNGPSIPSLKSKYIFADWTGPFFYLQKSASKWLKGNIKLQNLPTGLKITGFGEDTSGELYFLTNPDTGPGNSKGFVYKITKN